MALRQFQRRELSQKNRYAFRSPFDELQTARCQRQCDQCGLLRSQSHGRRRFALFWRYRDR